MDLDQSATAAVVATALWTVKNGSLSPDAPQARGYKTPSIG